MSALPFSDAALALLMDNATGGNNDDYSDDDMDDDNISDDGNDNALDMSLRNAAATEGVADAEVMEALAVMAVPEDVLEPVDVAALVVVEAVHCSPGYQPSVTQQLKLLSFSWHLSLVMNTGCCTPT